LGACGPLLLQLAVTDHEATGVVAGRIYSLGTAGSLLGTYASGLLLVPWLGTRSTLWLGAACLAALGILGRWQGRRRVVGAAILLLMAGAGVAWPNGPTKSRNTLFESESRYQYIQVTDDGTTRRLFLNEGYAVQSVFPKDGSLSLQGVWGYYAQAPRWTVGGPPRRILLAGFGGGTSARTFRSLFPNAHITGIELDPQVIEAGRRWFGLPGDVRVIADDARASLFKPPLIDETDRYDIILIDAFQFPYVPFHLCTVEYFRQLDSRLADGGAVVMNLGRDEQAHDVVDAVAHTLAQVLPVVRAVDVPARPNTIVVGTRHGAQSDAGLSSLGLPRHVERALASLPTLEPWKATGHPMVLTDDRAPVEGLTDGVIVRRVWSVLRGGWGGS
jgi:spermidine synthase